MELICIIWLNIYRASLIFWAVSTADSWEGCNYGITGAQGAAASARDAASKQTRPRGAPAAATPHICSWGSAWAASASPLQPDPADNHSDVGPGDDNCYF